MDYIQGAYSLTQISQGTIQPSQSTHSRPLRLSGDALRLRSLEVASAGAKSNDDILRQRVLFTAKKHQREHTSSWCHNFVFGMTYSSCPVAEVYGHTFDPDFTHLAPRPLRKKKAKELPRTRPIIGPEPSRRAPLPPQKPKRNPFDAVGQ